MLIPNQVMLAATAQAAGKQVPRFAKPTPGCKAFITKHAIDYTTKGVWEHHVIPGKLIPRHFLDVPIPDQFIVTVRSHFADKG